MKAIQLTKEHKKKFLYITAYYMIFRHDFEDWNNNMQHMPSARFFDEIQNASLTFRFLKIKEWRWIWKDYIWCLVWNSQHGCIRKIHCWKKIYGAIIILNSVTEQYHNHISDFEKDVEIRQVKIELVWNIKQYIIS